MAGDRLFSIVNTSLLLLFSVSILYPILQLVATSFSDPLAAAQNLVTVFPVDFTLLSYKLLFASNQIMLSYWNTILYCILTTTLTLIVCSMASYPLTIPSFHHKLRNFFVVIIIIPMFVNGGLIPKFLVIRALSLYDSIWAIILPAVISSWYIILFRTMMRSIPGELRESARMDGAGEFRVYLQIVMPLMKPVLATVALFATVSMWNSYFTPLIYLQDSDKYPLQIILRRLQQEGNVAGMIGTGDYAANNAGMMEVLRSAASVVTVGPIVLMYPFLQKYFVKGMMIGSLKG